MLIVWFFVYKKLAQFAVRGALPPRRSESPGCAAANKPSCVLHLLGSFIGSHGFSSLEQRPEFWVLHYHSSNGKESASSAGDQVWSLGQEDPLEKEMATHTFVLAWRIPWTEEPAEPQSVGSQIAGHDWVTNTFTSDDLGLGPSKSIWGPVVLF